MAFYYEEESSPEQSLTFDSIKHHAQNVSGLQRSDMLTKEGLYNNYAYFISDQCPWHLVVHDKGKETVFTGSLPKQIDDFLLYISNNNRKVSVAHRVGKYCRFPTNAVREGIVNAAIHFDASVGDDIIITIDSDSVTISSPGGYVEFSDNISLTSTNPRNPKLANLMVGCRYATLKGNGIRMMNDSYRSSGIIPGISFGDDSFTAIFPALDCKMSNADYASQEVLRFLCMNGSATLSDLSKELMITVYAANNLIDRLHEEGKVFRMCIGSRKRAFLVDRKGTLEALEMT